MDLIRKFRNSVNNFNRQVKRGDRAALFISFIALIISVVTAILTATSVSIDSQQADLAKQVATSNALIQKQSEIQDEFQKKLNSTQVAVNEYQKNLQSTQTALDIEFRSIMRQQSFPYLKSISPDYVVKFSEVNYNDNGERAVIEGVGSISFIVANDGGGQAGWWKSNWRIEPSQENVNLRILDIRQANENSIDLPYNIPGQYTLGVKIKVDGQLSTNIHLSDKTNYQLGKLLIQELQKGKTFIDLEFSNSNPLRVQIIDYQLDLPIVSISPNPPSPFAVTNADDLGIVCFIFRNSSGEVFQGTTSTSFFKIKSNLKTNTAVLKSNTCYSFPTGEYGLYWLTSNPYKQAGIDYFSVTNEEKKEMVAIIPEPPLDSKITSWINLLNLDRIAVSGILLIAVFPFFITRLGPGYTISVVSRKYPDTVFQTQKVVFNSLINFKMVNGQNEVQARFPHSRFSIKRIIINKNNPPEFEVEMTYDSQYERTRKEKISTTVQLDQVEWLNNELGIQITKNHH